MWECWNNDERDDQEGLGFLGAILGIATGVLGLLGGRGGPSSKDVQRARDQVAKNEEIKKGLVASNVSIAQGGTISQNVKYLLKKEPAVVAVAVVAALFFITKEK